MKKVVIIGGGISGLFSAYYLSNLDYKITIIDKFSFKNGCSHGNAGLIVPSHIIPLAAPGIIPMAIKWMFNSKSPFSFHPHLEKNFVNWCIRFFLNSTQNNVYNSIKPLRDIALLSSKLYQDFSTEHGNDFGLTSKGLLMLFKNSKTAEEETELAKLAKKYGITANELSRGQIKKLDPNCNYDVLGGVHYLTDSHLTPDLLIKLLIKILKDKNVTLIDNDSVESIITANNKIQSITTKNTLYKADIFIFAAGVWTTKLLKKIDVDLPIVAGKGYSFNLPIQSNFPKFPSILVDNKVAVTPMKNNLKIAGTMEIDNINNKIRMNRVTGMVNSFNKNFPDLNVQLPEKKDVWFGLRPCSIDGLPYIGNINKFNNLFVATGHAMLGLSLGPATGKLLSEIISHQSPSINSDAFEPQRAITHP